MSDADPIWYVIGWAWAIAIAATLLWRYVWRNGFVGYLVYIAWTPAIMFPILELGGCGPVECPPGTIEVVVNRAGDYGCR